MYYGAPRSLIPRVVGILSLCFAPIGVFLSLVFVLGPLDDHHGSTGLDKWQPIITWMYASAVWSVAVFGVHLTAGILATMYKPSAPRWMTIYGIVALVLVVAAIAVPLALVPAGGERHQTLMEDFVYLQVGYAVLAAPWPILALVLMNTRASKDACRRVSAPDLGRVFT